MSLLKAYLQQPKIQKVLSSKPQDEGFSLIELVVVVAVLAILAAIAIPSFTSLSDDARLNSAKSILANMYKECEFNEARTGDGFHTAAVNETPPGVTWDTTYAAVDTTAGCDGKAYGSMAGPGSTTCYVGMDMQTGTQYYGLNNGVASTPWPKNLEDCT